MRKITRIDLGLSLTCFPFTTPLIRGDAASLRALEALLFFPICINNTGRYLSWVRNKSTGNSPNKGPTSAYRWIVFRCFISRLAARTGSDPTYLSEMRKIHKKSRLGCLTCKRRKVKVYLLNSRNYH